MSSMERVATLAASEWEVCVECGLIPATDEHDAFCPWCGNRVPEPYEILAWGELRAAEEADLLERPSRSRRVA
jgi:hypothetical protein